MNIETITAPTITPEVSQLLEKIERLERVIKVDRSAYMLLTELANKQGQTIKSLRQEMSNGAALDIPIYPIESDPFKPSE